MHYVNTALEAEWVKCDTYTSLQKLIVNIFNTLVDLLLHDQISYTCIYLLLDIFYK